ncbi:hypothetical protein HK097_011038 [Rhizophlyctis rosea]|uniref:Uncharacterized protein n=1 Tax=Rhizophlyctis rosea TaxID=64517 RepID=A0AAD5X252_9FUNG|nr:hypothetical protein HK097_011038 [Rhizophlyctis rosea]
MAKTKKQPKPVAVSDTLLRSFVKGEKLPSRSEMDSILIGALYNEQGRPSKGLINMLETTRTLSYIKLLSEQRANAEAQKKKVNPKHPVPGPSKKQKRRAKAEKNHEKNLTKKARRLEALKIKDYEKEDQVDFFPYPFDVPAGLPYPFEGPVTETAPPAPQNVKEQEMVKAVIEGKWPAQVVGEKMLESPRWAPKCEKIYLRYKRRYDAEGLSGGLLLKRIIPMTRGSWAMCYEHNMPSSKDMFFKTEQKDMDLSFNLALASRRTGEKWNDMSKGGKTMHLAIRAIHAHVLIEIIQNMNDEIFGTIQKIKQSMIPKTCKVARRPKHGGWDEGVDVMMKDVDVVAALRIVQQVVLYVESKNEKGTKKTLQQCKDALDSEFQEKFLVRSCQGFQLSKNMESGASKRRRMVTAGLMGADPASVKGVVPDYLITRDQGESKGVPFPQEFGAIINVGTLKSDTKYESRDRFRMARSRLLTVLRDQHIELAQNCRPELSKRFLVPGLLIDHTVWHVFVVGYVGHRFHVAKMPVRFEVPCGFNKKFTEGMSKLIGGERLFRKLLHWCYKNYSDIIADPQTMSEAFNPAEPMQGLDQLLYYYCNDDPAVAAAVARDRFVDYDSEDGETVKEREAMEIRLDGYIQDEVSDDELLEAYKLMQRKGKKRKMGDDDESEDERDNLLDYGDGDSEIESEDDDVPFGRVEAGPSKRAKTG